MLTSALPRRAVLSGAAGALAVGARSRTARAAPSKLTFLTSWFAEAEHGGFCQAKATGPCDKAGLDVTIRMGGPQVNGMHLLTAGAADIILGYPSSEPFEARAAGANVNFLLFADEGCPPYSSTVVATDKLVGSNPEACQAFVKALLEGWRDYLRNPAPGNKLIQADNPKQTDDRLAFALQTMRDMHVLDRGEAASKGIGTMTAARWEQTRDFLVRADLLKASVPWQKAFTTRFTDDLKIMA